VRHIAAIKALVLPRRQRELEFRGLVAGREHQRDLLLAGEVLVGLGVEVLPRLELDREALGEPPQLPAILRRVGQADDAVLALVDALEDPLQAHEDLRRRLDEPDVAAQDGFADGLHSIPPASERAWSGLAPIDGRQVDQPVARGDDEELPDALVPRVPEELPGQSRERAVDLHLDRDGTDHEVDDVADVEVHLTLEGDVLAGEGLGNAGLELLLVREAEPTSGEHVGEVLGGHAADLPRPTCTSALFAAAASAPCTWKAIPAFRSKRSPVRQRRHSTQVRPRVSAGQGMNVVPATSKGFLPFGKRSTTIAGAYPRARAARTWSGRSTEARIEIGQKASAGIRRQECV
jgi:hypothetical protein